VKESLPAKLKGLVNKSEIQNDAVASLSPQDEQNIAALQSMDVSIEIGRFGCFLCVIQTDRHQFNGLFFRTAWVSRRQNG